MIDLTDSSLNESRSAIHASKFSNPSLSPSIRLSIYPFDLASMHLSSHTGSQECSRHGRTHAHTITHAHTYTHLNPSILPSSVSPSVAHIHIHTHTHTHTRSAHTHTWTRTHILIHLCIFAESGSAVYSAADLQPVFNAGVVISNPNPAKSLPWRLVMR